MSCPAVTIRASSLRGAVAHQPIRFRYQDSPARSVMNVSANGVDAGQLPTPQTPQEHSYGSTGRARCRECPLIVERLRLVGGGHRSPEVSRSIRAPRAYPRTLWQGPRRSVRCRPPLRSGDRLHRSGARSVPALLPSRPRCVAHRTLCPRVHGYMLFKGRGNPVGWRRSSCFCLALDHGVDYSRSVQGSASDSSRSLRCL